MTKNSNDQRLFIILLDNTLANAVVLSHELHMIKGGGGIYSLKNSVMTINFHF